MLIFSIYDSKAEAYMLPFFQPTIGTALRSIEMAANDPESMLHRYAQDYTLFQLGSWNEEKGVIIMEAAHLSIANLAELRRPEPQMPLFPQEANLADVEGMDRVLVDSKAAAKRLRAVGKE